MTSIHQRIRIVLLALFCTVLSGFSAGAIPARAQSEAEIQVIEERLEIGQYDYYLLPNLRSGQVLYVHVRNLSGNLDPFAALLRPETDLQELRDRIRTESLAVSAQGGDPLEALPGVMEQVALVWDDDSGGGYSAAFEYTVLRPGDYYLMVTSALAGTSFGEYRLTLGINAREVLTGEAVAASGQIGVLDQEKSSKNISVQAVNVSLAAESESRSYLLNSFDAGDSLYVRTEIPTSDLRPVIVLRNFGGKALRTANLSGSNPTAILQYTFPARAEGYQLEIQTCCEPLTDEPVSVDILVGLNDATVLDSTPEEQGRSVLQLPIPVKAGIRLQQITGVDQRAENFGAVATLRFEWQDPALAFSPETCNCQQKIYQDSNFNDFLRDSANRWPTFTIFNQQNNRWTQNRLVVVYPDGRALYTERFSTTLQAPDFDFTQFPFDQQTFYIRVDSLYPDTYYVFENDETYTAVGAQLGEEEWYVIEDFTEVTTESPSTRLPVSRYSFGFVVTRHLDYYIFRIMLPVLLIILVSWFTFFLKDYSKRVDVSSANLLLFIAYNFTIADDLPRLGYLTFMDTVLISAFAISVAVVLYNVVLVRLEEGKMLYRFQKIDAILVWAYPLIYLGTFAVLIIRII